MKITLSEAETKELDRIRSVKCWQFDCDNQINQTGWQEGNEEYCTDCHTSQTASEALDNLIQEVFEPRQQEVLQSIIELIKESS